MVILIFDPAATILLPIRFTKRRVRNKTWQRLRFLSKISVQTVIFLSCSVYLVNDYYKLTLLGISVYYQAQLITSQQMDTI